MKKLLNKFKEVPNDMKLQLTFAALTYYANGDYKVWLEEFLNEMGHQSGTHEFNKAWKNFTNKYDKIIIEIHDFMPDLLLFALNTRIVPALEGSVTLDNIDSMMASLKRESKDYLNGIDQEVATPRHLIEILTIMRDITNRLEDE